MTSYSAIFGNYFINWNFRIPIFHKPGFFFHPHRCSCGPLLLRSHPHTPGRYPGCFTNSLWMISFLCRVLGKFGVSSQGPCGQNHWLYIIDYISFAKSLTTPYWAMNGCLGFFSGMTSYSAIFGNYFINWNFRNLDFSQTRIFLFTPIGGVVVPYLPVASMYRYICLHLP